MKKDTCMCLLVCTKCMERFYQVNVTVSLSYKTTLQTFKCCKPVEIKIPRPCSTQTTSPCLKCLWKT